MWRWASRGGIGGRGRDEGAGDAEFCLPFGLQFVSELVRYGAVRPSLQRFSKTALIVVGLQREAVETTVVLYVVRTAQASERLQLVIRRAPTRAALASLREGKERESPNVSA